MTALPLAMDKLGSSRGHWPYPIRFMEVCDWVGSVSLTVGLTLLAGVLLRDVARRVALRSKRLPAAVN